MARAGRLICAGAAVALGFAACAGDDDTSATSGTVTPGPTGCEAAIPLEDPGMATGDTRDSTHISEGSCITGSAPEVRFKVTPAQTGMLDLTLEMASGEDLGLYVRSACEDAQSEIGCEDSATEGEAEKLSVPVTEGKPVWVIIDGYNADQAGNFTLTAASRSIACGDALVEGAEECDPPADGTCSAECTRVPEVCDDSIDNDGDGLSDCEDTVECGEDAQSCPLAMTCGAAAVLQPTVSGDSSTGTRYFAGSCTGSKLSPEAILFYEPPVAGALMLTLQSATDQGLYVRTTCEDPAAESGCLDDSPGGLEELLIVPVEANVPVTVFVDPADPAQAGPFTLNTSLEPSTENEPNDTPATGTPNSPQGVVGTIYPAGDVDFVKINVNGSGATLSAEITDLGNGDCQNFKIDSKIEIYGPDGATSLAANDDNLNFCSLAQAADLAAGQYFVRVEASQNAPIKTFAYRLTLQTN